MLASKLTATMSQSTEDQILRRLALQASGYTGADVERVVRRARAIARRQSRPMTIVDIEDVITEGRSKMSPELKWRVSVHESGHALAWSLSGIATVKTVATGQTGGGHTDTDIDASLPQTEGVLMEMLLCVMAGRAAEEIVFGEVLTGSAGSSESDLAKATTVALSMETTLGLSSHQPLLYVPASPGLQDLRIDRSLAGRVNNRLEMALAAAKQKLTAHQDLLMAIARSLDQKLVLAGNDLQALFARADIRDRVPDKDRVRETPNP
jgi:ATP-dependent Zn protease